MEFEAVVHMTLSVAHVDDEKETDYRDATEENISKYLLGVDKIPLAVWMVALAGAAERFSFYATTAPWRMLT
jgi:POT family proton-dependent oligopeptide transporter